MVDSLSYIPDPESEPEPEFEPAEVQEMLPLEEIPELEAVPDTIQVDEVVPFEQNLGAELLPDAIPILGTSTKTAATKINIKRVVFWGCGAMIILWLYQNCHRDIPLEQLKERYAFSDSRFIRVNGIDVHIRISGKGASVLLLHDAYSSLHTWTNWTKALTSHYQVISVDLPGFGLTGPAPNGHYDAMMYAEFLDSLTHELGLNKFHLAGNGLGAKMAWMYAKEPNNQIDKLILLNAPGFEKTESNPWFSSISRIPILHSLVRYITPRAYVRSRLEERFSNNDAISDSLVQRHFDLLLRPGNREAISDRALYAEKWPPAINNIAKINVPVMVIWGADDQCISPKNAYQFHQKMSQSALRIYPETGHWPQEENPEKTVLDVMKFLEGKF